MNLQLYFVCLQLVADFLASGRGLAEDWQKNPPQFLTKSASSDWSHYGFQRAGKAMVSVHYGHIYIRVPLRDLKEYFSIAYSLKTIMNSVARSHSNNTVLQSLNELIRERLTRMEHKHNDVMSFYTVYSSSTTEGRQKRFLGILAAGLVGLGLGSTLFGLLDQGKMDDLARNINKLGFRQDKLIHLLGKTNENVRLNRADIVKLKDALALLSTLVSDNQLEIEATVLSMQADHIMSLIENKLDLYVAAATAGARHRLAHGLLSYAEAKSALENVATLAKAKGLTPIVIDPHYLYQLEVSISFDNEGFNLIAHVPLTNDDQVLTMFRYLPFPIEVTPGLTVDVHPEHDILALHEASGSHFEMSHTDMAMCEKVHDYYICPHISYLARQEKPSCAMSLYKADHNQALKTCKLSIREAKDCVLPLGNNEFSTYTEKPTSYKMTCSNGTMKTGQLFHFHHFQLDEGCNIQLPNFVLFGGIRFQVEKRMETYKWSVPIVKIGHDMSPAQILDILSQINSTLPPTDPHTLAFLQSHFEPVTTWNQTLIVIATVAGVALILILIIYCLAARNMKRKAGFSFAFWAPQPKQSNDDPVSKEQIELLNNGNNN